MGSVRGNVGACSKDRGNFLIQEPLGLFSGPADEALDLGERLDFCGGDADLRIGPNPLFEVARHPLFFDPAAGLKAVDSQALVNLLAAFAFFNSCHQDLDLYPLLGAAFTSRGEGGTEQWIQVQIY